MPPRPPTSIRCHLNANAANRSSERPRVSKTAASANSAMCASHGKASALSRRENSCAVCLALHWSACDDIKSSCDVIEIQEKEKLQYEFMVLFIEE